MTSTGRNAPASAPAGASHPAASGAPAPVLELDRVTLELGDRTILRDTGFSVNQGEFIGVLGPNGAGKTTLMRAVLGLVPAAQGTIRVLGQPVERGNASIGYMPQTRSALAGRRVRGRDFVAMAADGHRWGLPHADAKTRADVERVLDLVGGLKLAERPLSELSGGERQRLLLAQCLLGNPKLLLLDEPLISLDPHHQKSVVELVRRVQRELGIAVLFSAHELNPLLNSLDRVLYLGSGVAALGTVDEVITRPVLSRLYGSPIDVMRVNGRIFVMSGDVEVEKHDHEHEHDEAGGHSHSHSHATDTSTMFEYDFMVNAFAASGIVAVLAGVVGYFLVMRGQTFAGHALSHVGFTGATGAVLIGISPIWGMIGFTLAAGVGMGALGERLAGRDVAIGVILSLSLGFGLLFLHFFTAYATQVTALLFGNVLGVNSSTLIVLAALGVVSLGALAAIMRPLLFASLQPELAEAKGVSLRRVSVLFLAIAALAVAACTQIVGVLLVFTLMVGPAAAAQNMTTRLSTGLVLAAVFALVQAWLGLTLAFYTDWPTSFWITVLSAVVYGGSLLRRR